MTLTFRHATLDNGLDVIAEVDTTAHSAAIGFFVKTGARDETAAAMGVSHFLEHMMFKGTARRSAADVDRDFDAIGANHNAYTTSEMTAFYAHCLPDHLGEAEEVLSDIMRPAIRADDFDDEKQVILEEIAMYRDQPFWILYERTMEVYFGAHPLGHRVLGTPETITALDVETMRAYFAQRYSSDNTVVAIAGHLDFDDIVGRITTHCGAWTPTKPGRARAAVTPPHEDFTLTSERANRHYLLMLAPAPSATDDRRYAASLLLSILGGGDGSRLHWALIETGLADEAVAQHDGRDGLGEAVVFCSCSPEQASEVEGVVRAEIDALVGSLTEDDLTRVRAKVATGATLSGELPSGRMRRLGRLWTYAGEYRSLEEELARIDAVTLEDLRAVSEAFPLAPCVIGRLTPGSGTA